MHIYTRIYVHIYLSIYLSRERKYKEYIERAYEWKHPTIYTLNYFQLMISLRKNK